MENEKEKAAEEYLVKHKIRQLFENLTAGLVYERPENPKEYMLDFIKELMNSRATQLNHPCLFDESNIKSLFGMLDVANTGYINYEKYEQALENLGVKNYDRNPVGAATDEISLDVFRKEAKRGLEKSSATFSCE